jgi:hypothetical protein
MKPVRYGLAKLAIKAAHEDIEERYSQDDIDGFTDAQWKRLRRRFFRKNAALFMEFEMHDRLTKIEARVAELENPKCPAWSRGIHHFATDNKCVHCGRYRQPGRGQSVT